MAGDEKDGSVYSLKGEQSEVLGRVDIISVPTPKSGIDRAEVREKLEEADPPAAGVKESSVRRRRSSMPSPSPDLRAEPADSADAAPREEVVRVAGEMISAVGLPTPELMLGPDPTMRARAAVDGLNACGPGDEEPFVRTLLRLGPPALLVVEQEFPGLLWFNRHLAHRKLPEGKNVGPLARALLAFGVDGVPSLLRLVLGGTADQRYYGALVSGDALEDLRDERSRGQLVEALGALLLDSDTQIRDVALHALTRVQGQACLDPLVTRLIREATSGEMDLTERVAALRALGVLRASRATPVVIEMLEFADPTVRDACWRVLRVLTAEDKGPQKKKWSAWWRKHGGRPRREWLMDGLMHKSADVRKIAHRELRRLSGYHVDFDPAGSRGERKRVQRLYKDWFEVTAAAPKDPALKVAEDAPSSE